MARRQSSDSPADQIARCRDFATSRGWIVADSLIVSDAGISGASRHNRPALLDLFARIDEWDVLLGWDSSRLARDSEDLGWIRNRLRARKRVGYEVSTGLDLFNVGSKVLGIMGEEFLVKLRADTQRGLRGRAERGLSTGGLAYGYRSEPVALDEHGRPVESAGFRIVVDTPAADVVRRMFSDFVAGQSLRGLAHALNANRIASARGRGWAVSALQVLLANPIYRGERIFNRSEWIKDHETGRRRRYERPESEWVRREEPDLAIVEPSLWWAARAEADRRRPSVQRGKGGKLAGRSKGAQSGRARQLLAGLCECGYCAGGFYDARANGRYVCGWALVTAAPTSARAG